MPISYPIPDKLRQMWQSVRQPLQDAAETVDSAAAWPLEDVSGPGLLSTMLGAGYPEKLEEAFVGGILNMSPGYIASNFRSPEQIQQLRRMMAEEMRSRGPVGQVPMSPKKSTYLPSEISEMTGFNSSASYPQYPAWRNFTEQISDPFEQIARGSWYHGLSKEARSVVDKLSPGLDPKVWGEWAQNNLNQGGVYTRALPTTNKFGFPVSLHDAKTMSGGKLGEPAGVSLSALPTEAVKFNNTGDEFIHRVLPLYGGSPQERLVNLMAPEGRGLLNDAYDVVYNRSFNPTAGANSINSWKGNILPADMLGQTHTGGIGPFNQQLSQELQSMGKRGILYNPQRWNEYEMLMLDPKYALPLDYRMFQEYGNPVSRKIRAADSSIGDERYATPGVRRGLSQIQDIMSQNKSRLGDIYSERPWTQRLNEENKQRLLEMIEPPYREQIGNQLFNRW